MLEIKDVLKNFGKFSGENLSESLFSIELQAYILQLYLKRYSGAQVFLCEFFEIFRRSYYSKTRLGDFFWTALKSVVSLS